MIQYPESIMVRCPICRHTWEIFDVEVHHNEGVLCAFCRTSLQLERFELVNVDTEEVIDVLWPLIRIGGSQN